MSDPDMNAVREDLLARLAALHDASAMTAQDRQPVTLDQSSVGRLSRMDSLQMQARALEAERRREIGIQRIKAALRRIDKDAYGFCILCDEPIAEKRLKADPAIPACLRCAAQAG